MLWAGVVNYLDSIQVDDGPVVPLEWQLDEEVFVIFPALLFSLITYRSLILVGSQPVMISDKWIIHYSLVLEMEDAKRNQTV